MESIIFCIKKTCSAHLVRKSRLGCKWLKSVLGGSKKVKVKILSEDVCYCDSGQYKRIFIDGILDERYHQNKQTLPIHDKEILLDYQKIHE